MKINLNNQEGRVKCLFSLRNTFNLDLGYVTDEDKRRKLDASGAPIMADLEVTGFTQPTEWTPEIDPGYAFPVEETKALIMGLELKDNILLTGDTGTGKTSLVEQVAARLNYSVIKINFDSCVTKQDLIGEWIVKDKTMEFQYGLLVMAFQMPGTIILLDEWDTISKECAFVLQRPLERTDRRILIMETGGELFKLHPDNVVVATANTTGQGDDSGLYSQGTNIQNYAQINRFSMTIRLKYLEEHQEVDMLTKRFPDLDVNLCRSFVRAMAAMREGFQHGDLSVPLSHRDLINWVEKYEVKGDHMWAARYCFLNRMSKEDMYTAEQILQRVVE